MRNQTQDVPNQPKTPQRSVRVSDETWWPAHAAAARRGERDGLSGIMRDSLDAFNLLTDEEWADLCEVAVRLGLPRPVLFSTAINEWVQRHKGEK